MVVLAFADIFGKPGRKAVAAALPELKQKYKPDFIAANVENLAGGRGVNRKTLNELKDLGFNIFTLGNHIWDNKEVYQLLESEENLFRPANFPDSMDSKCPGRGYGAVEANGHRLFVVNLMGRVFMDILDCPFNKVEWILKTKSENCPTWVDMHADATSEKYAMGWHLNGRVAAVVGSHSHVQTADERILPGGTAYITDVGLSGSFDSVIGLKPKEVIQKFLTRRPHPTQMSKENPGIACVVVEISDTDRKATRIERLRYSINTVIEGNDKELE